MTTPPRIAEALSVLRSDWLEGEVALNRTCQGSKHHSPTPLVLHRFHTPSGREVMLCGTCRDNVRVLTGLSRASEGRLPWPLRREFGNRIRAVAEV